MFWQLQRLRVTVSPLDLSPNAVNVIGWVVGYQGGSIGTAGSTLTTAEMLDQVSGITSSSASGVESAVTAHEQEFSVPRSRCFAGPQWLRTRSSATDPEEITTAGVLYFKTSAAATGSWTVTLRAHIKMKVQVDPAMSPELCIAKLERQMRPEGWISYCFEQDTYSVKVGDLVLTRGSLSSRDDKSNTDEIERIKTLIAKLKRLSAQLTD
jgi:hypothetical protein